MIFKPSCGPGIWSHFDRIHLHIAYHTVTLYVHYKNSNVNLCIHEQHVETFADTLYTFEPVQTATKKVTFDISRDGCTLSLGLRRIEGTVVPYNAMPFSPVVSGRPFGPAAIAAILRELRVSKAHHVSIDISEGAYLFCINEGISTVSLSDDAQHSGTPNCTFLMKDVRKLLHSALTCGEVNMNQFTLTQHESTIIIFTNCGRQHIRWFL